MVDEIMPQIVADYLDDCGEHEVASRIREGKTPRVRQDPQGVVLIGSSADGKRIPPPLHNRITIPMAAQDVSYHDGTSRPYSTVEYQQRTIALDVWHEASMSAKDVAQSLLRNYRSTIVPIDPWVSRGHLTEGIAASAAMLNGAIFLPRDRLNVNAHLRVSEDLLGDILLTGEV